MIQGFDIKVLAKLQKIYDLITSSPPGSTTWGSIVGTLSSQTDLQTALNGKFNNPTGTTSQYIRGDGSLATLPTSTGILHGTATGTDTYAVTITGPTAYNDGDAYLIRFTNGNTTTSTLNINGIGVVNLYRNNDGPIVAGDISDGAEMLCVYNSTTPSFQCIGTSPNSLITYVTNDDTVTITKGQPVYASGGIGDRLKVKLAYNTGDSTSAQTIGLVMSTSIASGQKGFIMMQGLLDGLSIVKPSDGWADGNAVYLGATAGAITKTKQYAPNHLVYLGFVTTASNGSAGRIYVRVQNGYEMDELHNVSAQSPSNNDGLFYNTSTSLWETKSIATVLGYTPGQGTVTSVAALTLGTSGTDLGSTVATETTTPVITLNVPTASATNRGVLSSTDWSTFNGKQNAITLTTTGTSGAATLVGSTLNIPQYAATSTYYKNSTTYSSSGTGTQALTSILIPANTFVAGDVVRVTARFKKTGTTGTTQTNIVINTSNTTAGSTVIKANVFTSTILASTVQGSAVIINNTTNTQLPWTATNQGQSEYVNTTSAWQESVAINWTVNQYILFVCNPNGAGDVVSVIFYMIEKL